MGGVRYQTNAPMVGAEFTAMATIELPLPSMAIKRRVDNEIGYEPL